MSAGKYQEMSIPTGNRLQAAEEFGQEFSLTSFWSPYANSNVYYGLWKLLIFESTTDGARPLLKAVGR